MILTERIAHAVAGGGVTVAYCRWKQSRVKPGATFRTVAGVVRVNTIEPVLIEQLNDADAGRAGYNSPDELTATFRGDPADPIFKIGLSWVAADPREALGNKAHLTPEEVADIDALLDRLDARTPWARATLGRIVQEPGITATALAAELPMGKEPLKRRIRTLKEHGLTHSRRIGYELSARGYAYLTATSHTTERPRTSHHRHHTTDNRGHPRAHRPPNTRQRNLRTVLHRTVRLDARRAELHRLPLCAHRQWLDHRWQRSALKVLCPRWRPRTTISAVSPRCSQVVEEKCRWCP